MLSERKVSVLHAIAGLLWMAGLGLILITIALNGPEGLPSLGLALVILGAVLNTRANLCHLEGRQRNAFEMGRDVGRAEARNNDVTRLR